MIWVGALQTKGQLSRLEPYKKDVRVVTVYTHTFVLGNEKGLADDREDPFYTATGATPEEAEAAAHMVYLRATACTHDMKRTSPTLLECSHCGVQQRTPMHVSHQPEAKAKQKKPARLFGLFRAS